MKKRLIALTLGALLFGSACFAQTVTVRGGAVACISKREMNRWHTLYINGDKAAANMMVGRACDVITSDTTGYLVLHDTGSLELEVRLSGRPYPVWLNRDWIDGLEN